MKISKNGCSFIIIFIILTSFIFPLKNQNSQANSIPVFWQAVGGILPGNDTELQMITAEVLMDINGSYGGEDELMVYFDGNYTIFNPNNTTELLIGAPFFTEYNIKDNLLIEIEGIKQDHTIIYFSRYNDSDSAWEEYIDIGDDRWFAICNVTFAGFGNTTIHYKFESLVSSIGPEIGYGVIFISYDVGTGNHWDGNITENVEYKIYGRQPDDYVEHRLRIVDFEEGKRYIWSWKEENIDIFNVYVQYDFTTDRILGFNAVLSFLSISFSLILLKLRFKKKSM